MVEEDNLVGLVGLEGLEGSILAGYNCDDGNVGNLYRNLQSETDMGGIHIL